MDSQRKACIKFILELGPIPLVVEKLTAGRLDDTLGWVTGNIDWVQHPAFTQKSRLAKEERKKKRLELNPPRDSHWKRKLERKERKERLLAEANERVVLPKIDNDHFNRIQQRKKFEWRLGLKDFLQECRKKSMERIQTDSPESFFWSELEM